MKHKLTMGPVLFNWKPEDWRDFYFRIADETDIDDVYIGEVVCSKRAPFFEPFLPEAVERLQNGGKRIIFSSLALVMSAREARAGKDLAGQDDLLVEANDISLHAEMKGKPHVIGPYINVYNAETLGYLAAKGAIRFCLPHELSAEVIAILSQAAKKKKAETEIQVFGRLPLALSGRCYHARHHGLSRDSCQFVCKNDPDGKDLHTLDGAPFLAINGIQTLSYTHVNLLHEIEQMKKMGVSCFRLSPSSKNMIKISRLYRDVLEGTLCPDKASGKLAALLPQATFSNGFYHGIPGHLLQSA